MNIVKQTTLANWRIYPYNTWSFCHVDALLTGDTIRQAQCAAGFDTTTPLDLHQITLPSGVSVERVLETTHTDAFIVMDNGRICCERYFGHHQPDSRHLLFSVTKSVTGILAGILVADGALDVSKSAVSYVPELTGSAWETATVRQILDMLVSVNFGEDYLDTYGAMEHYRVAMGWNPPRGDAPYRGGLHQFLPTLTQGANVHGRVMQYASPTADVLGWILERATGKTIAELLETRIWQPIGAEKDAWISVDKDGASRTAGGMCATARDMARFGEMIRQNGQCGETHIIPETWIADIHNTSNRTAWRHGNLSILFNDGHYRSQWYAPAHMPDALLGIGIHGQWLYVDPRRQVTLVKFSSQPLPEDDHLDQLNLALCDAVAEAVFTRRQRHQQ